MNRTLAALKLFICTIMLGLTSACATNHTVPYAEIEGYKIKEIAFPRVTRFDGDGVVVYNPEACEQIGLGCGFFKRSAYGHLWLRHPNVKPGHFSVHNENEADCWAAANGKAEETRAAVEFLLDPSRHEGLLLRGDLPARAALIKQCAKDAGKWSAA